MSSLWRAGRTPVPSTPSAPGWHEVVVVGAGITGLSTALMLARSGRDVAVVEAGDVAELSTGANTGKVSLLQGGVLGQLRRHHSASLVRAYVDSNRAGQEWLTAFAEEEGVPFTRRAAYSFAESADALPGVQEQVRAGVEAGLPVQWRDASEIEDVPFPVAGAAVLEDQIAIDPVAVADALARAFVAAGGTLHTATRVCDVHAVPHAMVQTDAGALRADRIVLATGTPIIDRGLYFAKTRGMRSLCVAFEVDGDVPEGMYLSLDEPSHSIRAVSPADGPSGRARLIVGGGGHPVGRARSESALYDELVDWTSRHFPGARETHRWSAQDYESHNLVPFVGAMPRTLGRVRFATGFNKWGLTNGPAAALRIAAEIAGVPFRERPAWMIALGTRLTVPADLGRGLRENALVGREAARGWTLAEATPVPLPRPAEGEGAVGNRAGVPVGVSTVGGVTRAVSAVCPHLGGVLAWNDAECTWDCPLHASRFAPDGTRLEGPAGEDLRRLGRGALEREGNGRGGAPVPTDGADGSRSPARR